MSNNKPSRKPEGSSFLLHAGFFLGLFFNPEIEVTPKRRLTFNGLQGVIFQKINLFITTAVRVTFALTAAYRLHRS
jgi:hypothetical protein